MHSYSGFNNQTHENQYNKLLDAFIKLILKRLNKFYLQQDADEGAFKILFTKILNNLKVFPSSIGHGNFQINKPQIFRFISRTSSNLASLNQRKRGKSNRHDLKEHLPAKY